MIKTVICENPAQLDKEVNDFMVMRKQNLPVRTEVFVTEKAVYHKATIFFDESFNANKDSPGYDVITEEPIEEYPEVKKTYTKMPNERIGAIWIQKDGSMSGKFRDLPIVIPPEVKERIAVIVQGKELDLTMKGEAVFIIRNKFKKEPRQPDFIIYQRE